jgi:spore germination protein KA
VRALRTWDEILGDLLSGHTLVFAPGSAVAWSAPTADPPARSIDRPVTEAVSRGPDEAFTEALGTQIGQVRRYLGTPALQVRTLGVGDAFGKVAVVYLESLANPALVDTVLGRLGRVTGRLRPTATAIAGAIRDHPRSIFPTVRSTERVGFVIGALAQGKVAILVDGDPFALLVPAPLADFYRTEQDDTGAWPDASFVRVIRFVGWAMGVYLPALFVAVTQVNPNVIPMSLLITFAGSRAGLPATPLAEVVVMILILETLREAAFRLPKVLGTTIGTVGAIVVGTSVVSAGIVSPQVIVVITLTALSFFTAPVYELTGTWRLVNLAMLLTAAYLGVVGIVLTTMLVLSEITSMTSFGVPYFAPWAPLRLREWADTLLRLPWQSLRWRPADPRPLDRTLPPLPRRGVPDLRPNPR